MNSGSQTKSKYGLSEAKSVSTQTLTKKSFLTTVLSPKSLVFTN